MKKSLLSLILAIVSTLTFAQKPIEVTSSSEGIGGSTNPAFVVEFEEGVKKGDIEKAWKGVLKDMDAKVSSKKEMIGEQARNMSISSNAFTVYSKVVKVSKTSNKIIVAFDMGDRFLTAQSNATGHAAAKKIIYEYAVNVTKNFVMEEVKENEKKYEKLMSEQKILEKNNTRFYQIIEDSKKRIAEAEDDIKQNEKDQEKKKQEIEQQKKHVELVKQKLEAVK